jgi:hypothetical protein
MLDGRRMARPPENFEAFVIPGPVRKLFCDSVHDRPADVAANERIAAHQLKQSGKADQWFKTKT